MSPHISGLNTAGATRTSLARRAGQLSLYQADRHE